jgi:carbonic anhydrase
VAALIIYQTSFVKMILAHFITSQFGSETPHLSNSQCFVTPIHKSKIAGLLERENIMHSIRNLQACPWIEDRLANKSLALNGFRFDIKNGALETVYSSEEP